MCTYVHRLNQSERHYFSKNTLLLQTCSIRVFFQKLKLEEVYVDEKGNEKWYELYRHDVPVLHFNDELLLKHFFDEEKFVERLEDFEDLGK